MECSHGEVTLARSDEFAAASQAATQCGCIEIDTRYRHYSLLGTHILHYYFYEENVPLARAAAIRKACGTPQRRRVAAPVSSAHHSLMSLDTIVHSYIRVNDELPNHEAVFFL